MLRSLRNLFGEPLEANIMLKEIEFSPGETIEGWVELKANSSKKKISSVEAFIVLNVQSALKRKCIKRVKISSVNIANEISLPRANEKRCISFFVPIPDNLFLTSNSFSYSVEVKVNTTFGKGALEASEVIIKPAPQIKRILSTMQFLGLEHSRECMVENNQTFVFEDLTLRRRLWFKFMIERTGVLCKLIFDSFSNNRTEHEFFIDDSLDIYSVRRFLQEELGKLAGYSSFKDEKSGNQNSILTEVFSMNSNFRPSVPVHSMAEMHTATIITIESSDH